MDSCCRACIICQQQLALVSSPILLQQRLLLLLLLPLVQQMLWQQQCVASCRPLTPSNPPVSPLPFNLSGYHSADVAYLMRLQQLLQAIMAILGQSMSKRIN
jgi:hypothetical protein